MSPGSAKTTSSVVSYPSALRIAYPTSRSIFCWVAVAKIRFRRGVIPTLLKTSFGNQVSSKPEGAWPDKRLEERRNKKYSAFANDARPAT